MANLSIPAIRERLFNTSKHEQTTQRSTNPFAANTFKGNVLTADVFESSTKQNQPVFTGKLKASALVGTISGIGEKFQNIINSVVGFGNRIKENVVNGWNKLEGIEISFNPLKEKIKNALNTPIELFGGTGITSKAIAKTDDMAYARQVFSDGVNAWEAVV